ncbi:hypothetical protein QCA50_017351 [Cerrena zonata]|uniref:Uncharacterized protein n=1 Tax=Cerrena zonata TaxID=2478898 RepID=A0AAW0FL21_9APHY
MARAAIYERGKGVKSTAVEDILSPLSYVPTSNAFADSLGETFDYFSLFVVDLMHEIELGVWKALFIHLIRILVSLGGNAIQLLNERFRQIPAFGSSICRFDNNSSALKKLAARNYEDFLQCSMPVFEGLFDSPDHDRCIQDLLFVVAEWHANAKLRLHTNSTVKILEELTRTFGFMIRYFTNKICPTYQTRELPREEAARVRRQAKKASQGNQLPTTPAANTGRLNKTFQLLTYKLHAMGDYVWHIIRFGTTDSYSTQTSELEHRSVKQYYARTNKIQHARHIARIHRRERLFKKTLLQNEYAKLGFKRKRGLEGSNERPKINPADGHHYISPSRNSPIRVLNWIDEHEDDLAFDNFMLKLRNHLVGRLRNPGFVDDGTSYSTEELGQVCILSDRIYDHKTMRLNYTTYDLRQEYDMINLRSRADVMAASPLFDPLTCTSEDGHPFVYAHVLGIYHAEVIHTIPGQPATAHTMEFLFVRWYQRDTTFPAGFKQRRLHRVAFRPPQDVDSYGFLDPDDVIRGAHIIPAFAHGELAPSLERRSQHFQFPKWNFYYINLFVDRDMYMRYQGGGVGHVPAKVDDPERADETILEDEDLGLGEATGEAANESPRVDEGDDETSSHGSRSEGSDIEGPENDDDQEEDHASDDELNIGVDSEALRNDLREDLGFADL